MQNDSLENTRPWFKEPYVWLMLGLPTASVIACIFLISLAVSTKDTLVRDNYYKDGMAMNQELKWDKKAKNMDIKLSLSITKNSAEIHILSSRLNPSTTLQLKISHPTLADKDRDAFLQLKPNTKMYQGFIDEVEEGRYYIQVESAEQQWRIRKELIISNAQVKQL